MKIIKITAAAVSAAVLGGCTLFSPAEGLLTPPKLSEEQRIVYDALTESVGSVNPVFPKNGDDRSAYLFGDYDGDGIEEAAVFYQRINGGESTVRLNILDPENSGRLRSVYDCAGGGITLDKVITAKIGASDKTYIAAGYDLLTAGDKVLEVYRYDSGRAETVYSGSYSDFMISDFTSDGQNELLIVKGNSENQQAAVLMLSDKEGVIGAVSSVNLCGNILGFENITEGKAAQKTNALFIDEISSSGTVSTEIVYAVGTHLRNPAGVEGSNVISDTERQSGYISLDVDGDGITEIPVTEVCPGYENENEKLLITNWCVLSNYGIEKKYTGWYARNQGWCLMFPSRWEGGLVTVKQDSITGASVFCKYGGSVADSTELMRINAVRHEESETMLEDGWVLIKSADEVDYFMKPSAEAADETAVPVLTLTEVQNNFYTL